MKTKSKGLEPLVDVAMGTYNHEGFIAQALESVLAQKTSFPYRIIISDDLSTDNTRSIIMSYVENYPGRIITVFPDKHVGILHKDRPYIKVLQQCTAKYIAMLEGDDYWTDPYKLQKQVDLLESHPECSICFHAFSRIGETENSEPELCYPPSRKTVYSLEDLLRCSFIGTVTVVFRRGLFKDFPDWYYEMPIGDYPLHVFNAQHGDIRYIDEVMAVYRVHSGGLWSQANSVEISKRSIKVYHSINKYLQYEYDKAIKETISLLHFGIAQNLAREKDFRGALFHLMKCLFTIPFRNNHNKFYSVLVFLEALAPRLFIRLRNLKNSIFH